MLLTLDQTNMHGENNFTTETEIASGGCFCCSRETPAQSSRNLEEESLLQNSNIFYEKLVEFHESSGLSLVINFRETTLDLYLFYMEVTQRGGFQKVTNDEKWDEVASVLNLTRSSPNLSLQLQKLYAQLLYQFEKIYLSCSNAKPIPDLGNPFTRNPARKRKQGNNFTPFPTDPSASGGFLSGKWNSRNNICQSDIVDLGTHIGKTVKGVIETEFDSGYLVKVMVGSKNLNGLLYHAENCAGRQFAIVPSLMDGVGLEDLDSEPVGLQIRVGTSCNTHISPTPTSAKSKGMKKDPYAPRRLRSAYQLFLSKECDRLKKMCRGSVGQNIRKLAIDAWKHLSVSDRQPYMEESQKDRERYYREMIAYRKRQNTQFSEMENYRPRNHEEKLVRQMGEMENRFCEQEASVDDYHVTLQTEVNKQLLVQDESMVELAVRMMEHAKPDDPILQINWDDLCGSLDIPE